MTSTLITGLNDIARYQYNKITDGNISIIQTPHIVTDYMSPIITYNTTNHQVGFEYYDDLNKDHTVQKATTKYYFYKLIDKWLFHRFKSLLGFIEIIDNKPKLIKSISDYKEQDDETRENIKIKINFLEKILITKNMVKHVITKLITKNNKLKWYNLYKHEDIIKDTFFNYIKQKLKRAIGNKQIKQLQL